MMAGPVCFDIHFYSEFLHPLHHVRREVEEEIGWRLEGGTSFLGSFHLRKGSDADGASLVWPIILAQNQHRNHLAPIGLM